MTEGTGVGGELKSRADTPTPRSAKLCAEAMTASVPGKDTVLSFIQHPVDLPNPGIKLGSPALQEDSYQLSYQGIPIRL